MEEETRVKAEAARLQAEEEARFAEENQAKDIAIDTTAATKQINIEEEARVKDTEAAVCLQAEEESQIVAEVPRLVAFIKAAQILAEGETRAKVEATR